jgi:hypothetical protein
VISAIAEFERSLISERASPKPGPMERVMVDQDSTRAWCRRSGHYDDRVRASTGLPGSSVSPIRPLPIMHRQPDV